jgi:transposase
LQGSAARSRPSLQNQILPKHQKPAEDRHLQPISRLTIYNNRNRVERLWARLKEWRAVATRYEKTAASFLGVLCLAATADWLRR